MPFQHKPQDTTRRRKFTKRDLEQAISEIQGGASIRKTAIKYDIDRTTLRSDEDFMCSAVTDRDISNENYELTSSSSQCRQAQLVFSSAQQDPPDFPQSFNDVDLKIPSTSQQIPNDEVQDPPYSPLLDLNNVSLLDSVTVSLTNNQLNPPAQKSPQTSDKVLKSFSHAPSDSEPNSLNCSKVYLESLVNCCLTKLNDTLMAKLNCNLEVSFHQCQEAEINYYYPPNSPTLTQKLDIPQTPDHITKKVTITPEIIRPYPKAAPRKTTRRGRQPGKTKILTKTPKKITDDDSNEILKKTTTKAKGDKSSKTKAKKNIKRGKKVDTKKAKRQVLQEKNNDTDCEDDFKADFKKMKEKVKQGKNKIKRNKDTGPAKTKKRKINKQQKRSRTFARSIDSESEENYDDCIPYADSSNDGDWEGEGVPELDTRWYCFICGTEELLDMRLCISCKRYVHEECVGLTINDSENFMCPECD
ncbi:unnamed protein product [Parnassius apollo]|uniref:(apollo) hypothetical protein n=1 Tax=Parnassius apollo TaxID=110799 RepID=A0A8S3W8Q9_PARAO|nr:unnamed protein product [Parnassius apollo]